jgi:hypothetical protein
MARPYSINEDGAVPLLEKDLSPKKPVFLSVYWTLVYCSCVLTCSISSTVWHFSANFVELFLILQLPPVVMFVIDRCLRVVHFGVRDMLKYGGFLDILLCAVDIGDLIVGPSGTLGVANARNVSSVVWIIRLYRLISLGRLYNVVGFKAKFVPKPPPSITHDRVGRVWKYSAESLFSFGFAWNLAGTVLACPELFTQFVILSLAAMLYALNMCNMDCSHSFIAALPANDSSTTYCPTLCFSLIDSSSGLAFGGIVAFMMGLFNSNTYTRWWTIRDKIGTVSGRTVNCTMLLVSFVTGEDQTSKNIKITLVRYLNLAYAIIFKQAMGNDNYSDLVAQRLLTEEEYAQLKERSNHYVLVYQWVYTITAHALKLKILTSDSVALVQADLGTIRGAAGDVFMYLNCQQPYVYTHLMTAITKLHLLLVTVVAGSYMGAGLQRSKWTDVAWGFLLLLVHNFVYQGLLYVHQVLQNPVSGADVGHFPQEEYLDSLSKTTTALLQLPHSAAVASILNPADR